MILHLMTDEQFTDYTIQHFSSIDPDSEFVLIPSNGTMEMVHLIDKCRVVHRQTAEFDELLNQLGNYSAIILHGMHWGSWETPILQNVPDHVKVAWNLWGGDIYGRQDISDSFLMPLDRLINRLHALRTGHKDDSSWEINKALFQRIDYCLADESEEFEYVQQYTGNYRMKHLWYAVFSIEKTIGSFMDKRAEGENIWFSNRATISSNHFDTICRFVRHGIGKRTIIAPLSYSSVWIRNRVSTIGRLIWGERFKALTSYMPREEYNRLMLSCGTMIMPAHIPQGHGNIMTGLWLGMRVYMSEKSIAYDFFKRIGAHVFSYESEFKKYRYSKVSDKEVEESRKALQQLYSMEHVMQSVKNIVKELNG